METEASNEAREVSKSSGVLEVPRRPSEETRGPLSLLSSKLPVEVGAKISDDKTHFAEGNTEVQPSQ